MIRAGGYLGGLLTAVGFRVEGLGFRGIYNKSQILL